MIGKKYDSPLSETVSSTLLGTADFIDYIKKSYLKDKKVASDMPALKELSEKTSIKTIIENTDKEFEKDHGLARGVKIYLCQRYTGDKLKDIGTFFGIGESGVSQASRRVAQRIDKDKTLRKKINEIEQRLRLSRMKN